MDREDTKKVLKILATAYPRYFADMGISEKQDQVNLYQAMFGEYETEIVIYALNAYIKDNEYPPSIAGLQKQIDLLMPHENVTDLWNVLAKACAKGSVMTAEEFDRLPEPIKIWCGDVAQIKELSQTDLKTFNTVTRGQFNKTIPVIIERQKVQETLPVEIREKLTNEVKQIGGTPGQAPFVESNRDFLFRNLRREIW